MFRWLSTIKHTPARRSEGKTNTRKNLARSHRHHVLLTWMSVWRDLRGETTGCGDVALIFVERRQERLTCCRWCRRHCFPPHTAPVLGKHAEPAEQSGPGESNCKSCKLLIWFIRIIMRHMRHAWIQVQHAHIDSDIITKRQKAGCTCCWTGTCWVEPVGWTGTVVWRGTVEVESAPASGVCMAPE